MQAELDTESHPVPIRILGVNGVGHESGNAGITSGRDLPWLQDVETQEVWKSWGVAYRDVILLDTENRPVAVYNLSTHDLSNETNYAELKKLFVDAAAAP